jgi:hypothetical protein
MKTRMIAPTAGAGARSARALGVILVAVQVVVGVVAVVFAGVALASPDRVTGRELVCGTDRSAAWGGIGGLAQDRLDEVPLAGAECVLVDPDARVIAVGDVVPRPQSVGVVAADGTLPVAPGCRLADAVPDSFVAGTRGDGAVAQFYFPCVESVPLALRVGEALFVSLVPAAVVVVGAHALRSLLTPLRRGVAMDFTSAGVAAMVRLRRLALAFAAVAALGALVGRAVDEQVIGTGRVSTVLPIVGVVAAIVFGVLAAVWGQAAHLQREQEGVI